MKTAVIVGRFQADELHQGYLSTFSEIENQGFKKLVLVLGEAPVRLTYPNPIPYRFRKLAFEKFFSEVHYNFEVIILKFPDFQSDIVWSEKLDEMLEYLYLEDFSFVVGRDSFKDYYHGKYQEKFLEFEIEDKLCSSSLRRDEVFKLEFEKELKNIREVSIFNQGLIYASQYQYPIVFPTVDILLYDSSRRWILLGKKPNENFLRLPGGFVDGSDESIIEAAYRELTEEGNIYKENLQLEKTKIIHTQLINDWRYRSTQNRIMTTLVEMTMHKLTENPEAGDDLEKVEWRRVSEIKNIDIFEPHKEMLIKVLNL